MAPACGAGAAGAVGLECRCEGLLDTRGGPVEHDVVAHLDDESFEITMVAIDQAFAGEVEKMLVEDFTHCREVHADEYDRRPFWFKVAVQTSRLLAPIQ